LYDYSARFMDAALGQFTTVDPMAEKYYSISPYAYVGNNPVRRTDPTGMDWYEDKEGNLKWQEGSEKLKGYTNIGSSVSIQTGENSYLNFYQNAGIPANQAVNAFDLIAASPKLQNQLLGKNSVLSEDSQSQLFNRLNSKGVDAFARPIGEAITIQGFGVMSGAIVGKGLAWTAGKIGGITGNIAAKGGIKIGQSFDKLGTIIENPGLSITSFSKHGVNQAITRGVQPATILNTIKNPVVVLQQNRGNLLYLSREAAVVINPSGRVVSTYPASMFDSSILNV
ncbi:MAG: hypothetical protein LIP08_05005, partial [Bacteroides sp.]|nr:hypothetical protein [Bacteroides sp.]